MLTWRLLGVAAKKAKKGRQTHEVMEQKRRTEQEQKRSYRTRAY